MTRIIVCAISTRKVLSTMFHNNSLPVRSGKLFLIFWFLLFTLCSNRYIYILTRPSLLWQKCLLQTIMWIVAHIRSLHIPVIFHQFAGPYRQIVFDILILQSVQINIFIFSHVHHYYGQKCLLQTIMWIMTRIISLHYPENTLGMPAYFTNLPDLHRQIVFDILILLFTLRFKSIYLYSYTSIIIMGRNAYRHKNHQPPNIKN